MTAPADSGDGQGRTRALTPAFPVWLASAPVVLPKVDDTSSNPQLPRGVHAKTDFASAHIRGAVFNSDIRADAHGLAR